MNRTNLFFMLLSCFAICSSCQQNEVEPTTDNETQLNQLMPMIEKQMQAQEAIKSILAFVQELKGQYLPNGRATEQAAATYDNVPACAKVTTDVKNKTITVDFGTGSCKTPNGQTTAGQLTLTIVNQTIKVEMKNLRLDDVSLNGAMEVGGMYAKTSTPEISVIATNLQVSYNNSTSTFNMNLKQKWQAGFGTPQSQTDDAFLLSINGNMVVSEGNFDVSTQKDLQYKGSCDYITSGIVQFSKTDLTARIDYGNDTCDNKATITVGSYTKEVNLDDLY
ncbi:hypothetical protein [Emticicia sp. BO119]|uniref:hypothetical protein n=1 Tax=Emticicia sp. BO119 TaxID=2757768 RepID=UPI0015F04D71|nr:hypothetical protein [Emticicia sp. BO119]